MWAPRLDAQKTGWRPGAARWPGCSRRTSCRRACTGSIPPDPCKNFDTGSYLTNVLAHYFATEGTDLDHLSHPNETASGPTDPKAATACTWP